MSYYKFLVGCEVKNASLSTNKFYLLPNRITHEKESTYSIWDIDFTTGEWAIFNCFRFAFH